MRCQLTDIQHPSSNISSAPLAAHDAAADELRFRHLGVKFLDIVYTYQLLCMFVRVNTTNNTHQLMHLSRLRFDARSLQLVGLKQCERHDEVA